MIALVACIAAVAFEGLPQNFVGLWADKENNPYIVTSPESIEYIDGFQWGAVAEISKVPNGDYLGSWAQGKVLTPVDVTRTHNAWRTSQFKPYKPYKGTPCYVLDNADNRGYAGEWRFALFPNGSSGKFTANDVGGKTVKASLLSWICTYDKITVSGEYSEKYTSISIHEEWTDSGWSFHGAFENQGKKYVAEGKRLFSRSIFDIIDVTTGRKVGSGVWGYAPTPTKVGEFRSGNFGPTDRIMMVYSVGGTTQVKYLTRQ